MKKYLAGMVFAFSFTSCLMDEESSTQNKGEKKQEVNVYTHRHYDVDRKIFKKFEKETGIDVNIIDDDADKLLIRLEKEGKNSPCDLFMTVDAGRLVRAKNLGLLQSIQDEKLLSMVPGNLRDSEGYWMAQTVRARIIVYSKERVDTNVLSTYEDLADPKWKGKLLVRSSDNIYNQSLLASMIAHNGHENASKWALGVVANLAREPKGNDKDQVKAIAAGEGDISLVNTYYVGRMLESDDQAEVDAAKKVGVFYPNQKGRGAHINISGAGIAKYAPNKTNAEKLLAFMLREDIQKMFADANNEFPVDKMLEVKPLLATWGTFLTDTLGLQKLGELNNDALKIFNQAGWK
jgi:iron(III) transport system substrate-binding protein